MGQGRNSAAVKALLTRLRDQGLPTDRKYLFIIDGAKALRAARDKVEILVIYMSPARLRSHRLLFRAEQLLQFGIRDFVVVDELRTPRPP